MFIFWLVCLTIYITGIIFLSLVLIRNLLRKDAWSRLRQEFHEGFKSGGILGHRRYPVELWKWETMEDGEVCEDCLERAAKAPMDIADWMKEGMPRTAEARTKCGEHCRCQLVIAEPNFLKKNPRR